MNHTRHHDPRWEYSQRRCIAAGGTECIQKGRQVRVHSSASDESTVDTTDLQIARANADGLGFLSTEGVL